MHSYSIDKEERNYILLFLIIVSIFLSWGLYKLLKYYQIILPWWVDSPSVLFFYGILFAIFDKWVWRFFSMIGLLKTPNLNGEWQGNIKSSFDNHESEIKATLKIFQTWTRIKILLTTEQSVSKSEVASIITEAPEGKYLNYQYINEPIPGPNKTMSIHRGTTRLLFNEKDKTLSGEYYSGMGRQNFGSLVLKKD